MSETREVMKAWAFNAGEMLGQGAGDFYDVVAELTAGYAAGVGAVELESDFHYRTVIAALNELASVAGHVLEGIVDDAREHHVPWSVIGDGLDVSRQAAQQKYGKSAVVQTPAGKVELGPEDFGQ